ncbi:hypothetical protein A3461_02025 [Enterobacter roggenkampii]|nr:hypothetical protein A3461_02025 [Enterobacter roggenkampii]
MMTLITINRVYYLIGFVVMLLVVMTLRDRANPKRFTTALFWFLFGGIFLFGDLMVQELGKSLAYRIIGGGRNSQFLSRFDDATRSSSVDIL